MSAENVGKLGIAAGGCLVRPSPTSATDGKRIDESSNGKTVAVRAGETLVIRLRENFGSTGAKWRVTAKGRSLPPVTEKFIPSKGARMPGATIGGIREFAMAFPKDNRPGGYGGEITIERMRGDESMSKYTVHVKFLAAEQPSGAKRVITGTVENRSISGPGGEAPPSGPWLKLARPITVQGRKFDAVFIGGKKRAEGATVTLRGTLEQGHFGGVTTRGGVYARIVDATQVKPQSAS